MKEVSGATMSQKEAVEYLNISLQSENRLVIVCQESDGTGSMLTLENDKLHFQKLIPIEKWIEGLKPIEVE